MQGQAHDRIADDRVTRCSTRRRCGPARHFEFVARGNQPQPALRAAPRCHCRPWARLSGSLLTLATRVTWQPGGIRPSCYECSKHEMSQKIYHLKTKVAHGTWVPLRAWLKCKRTRTFGASCRAGASSGRRPLGGRTRGRLVRRRQSGPHQQWESYHLERGPQPRCCRNRKNRFPPPPRPRHPWTD